MKIAFSTLGCPDWEFETVVKRAKEYGYDGLEIRGILREFDLAKVPELTDRADQAKAFLQENGIAIACISASSRFTAQDAAERKANVQSAKAHMDIARDFGAPCIRVFGGNIPDGIGRERCEDYIAECLMELGDYGSGLGVRVALETHDSFCLGRELAAVLYKADHPMVGALWDVYHPLRNGESVEETMRFLSGRVLHVHVKDGDFKKHALLGEGKVPTLDILKLLKDDGYDGYLSVEWEKAWHPDLPEPEEVFPQYGLKLREYLSSI